MQLSVDEVNELLSFAESLADAAADAIRPHFRTQMSIEDKGKLQFDPVTVADKAAERTMRNLIMDRYPEHGILGEEEGNVVGSSPFTWVLDPIDGTRAFITGLPLWGTLIGLNDGDRPILGVMNQPFTGERFIGTPQGAWGNRTPLSTRQCTELANAIVMCTTPQMFSTDAQREAFGQVASNAKLLRYGGDCYAYCMLASGYVDAIVEADLKPYDVQALIPIIEGAGGVITTWEGLSAQNGGTVVACGDRVLHRQLVEILRKGA